MAALISLQEAKDQVFATQPQDDTAIDRTARLASGIVLDYVGPDPVTGVARTWTETTAPDVIKAAVLLVFAKLWMHRGDEEPEKGYLSPQMEALLDRYKEPIVA